MLFEEVKRHFDKPEETYTCELVSRGADWVILAYVSDRNWVVADTHLPVGSKTLALYQVDRPQVLWRMSSPNGDLMGHLFHLCRDVVLHDGKVSYQDLLLDIWVNPSGDVTVLDWEDVDVCRKAGRLSGSDLDLIKSGEIQILNTWQDLIASFDRLIT